MPQGYNGPIAQKPAQGGESLIATLIRKIMDRQREAPYGFLGGLKEGRTPNGGYTDPQSQPPQAPPAQGGSQGMASRFLSGPTSGFSGMQNPLPAQGGGQDIPLPASGKPPMGPPPPPMGGVGGELAAQAQGDQTPPPGIARPLSQQMPAPPKPPMGPPMTPQNQAVAAEAPQAPGTQIDPINQATTAPEAQSNVQQDPLQGKPQTADGLTLQQILMMKQLQGGQGQPGLSAGAQGGNRLAGFFKNLVGR